MNDENSTEVPIFVNPEGDSEWEDDPDTIIRIKDKKPWATLYRIDMQYDGVFYTFEEPSS